MNNFVLLNELWVVEASCIVLSLERSQFVHLCLAGSALWGQLVKLWLVLAQKQQHGESWVQAEVL